MDCEIMAINHRMYQSQYRPGRLFVHQSVYKDAYTQEIVGQLNGLKPEIVSSESEILSLLSSRQSPEALGKRYLYLTKNKGRFMKACPGMDPELACCHLWVMNFATGCNLDCTYCFLQTYLPASIVTFFVNVEDLWNELDDVLSANPKRVLRICTGELSDSLSLDHLVQFTPRLIRETLHRKRISLELKTKSANIALLEKVQPQRRITVSWSLNAKSISKREEHLTASLEERLMAAQQVEAWGYRVAFHFEPLFYLEGWEVEYQETVRRIFEAVRPETIAFISMGTIR